MTWSDALALFSSPNGIAIAAGIFWSAFVEYWPQFEALESKWKRLVFLALSLSVPLVVAGLGIWTMGWSLSWEATFWPAIVAGVTAFAAGQVAHIRKLG